MNISDDQLQHIVQQVVKRVMNDETKQPATPSTHPSGDWGVFDDMNDAIAAAEHAFNEYEQFDIQDGWILAPHGDRPRVRFGHFVDMLPRIIDDHAAEDAVGVERQERRSVFVIFAFRDQERRPVVGWLGKPPITNTVVSGDRLPDTRDCHSGRNVDVSGEEIDPSRDIDD